MRERQVAAAQALDRAADQDTLGSAALCAITTVLTSYSTSAAVYYACNPALVTGTEAEGGAATFTVDTNTVIYALNVGTAVPPQGTKVIIQACNGRHVFRYDG
jgi:hypothetical protein